MRGTGGPLNITIHPTKLPVLEAMIAAAAEMDVPTVDDLNSIDGAGFGYQPRNIWKGRSEERRVGKECVSTCRARGSTCHSTKKKHNKITKQIREQSDKTRYKKIRK